MTHHEQVMSSKGFYVDVGLLTILEAVWRCGLDTHFSCQGTDDEDAYILFHTPAQALKFIKYTAAQDKRHWGHSVHTDMKLTIYRPDSLYLSAFGYKATRQRARVGWDPKHNDVVTQIWSQ